VPLRRWGVPGISLAISWHFYLAVSVHYRLSQRIFKSIQFSNAVKKILFVMIVVTIAIIVTPAAIVIAVTIIS
jgi:hypothetical protein